MQHKIYLTKSNVLMRMIAGLCLILIAGCAEDEPQIRGPIDGPDSKSETHAEDQRNFTAHLSGDNEVGPVETGGTGQAVFKLNKDGTELHYKLIVANIEDVTQSHIHCGPAGVNGPVIVFLFGFVAGGVDVNGVLAEGTITAADIIPRPDSEACMGGVANFENLLEKMRSGDAYVNVHTVTNPGGEIRGQIK